ncbi:MAG: nitroreductase family deazaflavin-dependent oxidoreductase [Acidobacteria bacterium]|nr:nitroreductase family deazaflavin-dependent oxidoreductase [Acidobacteriota bacterium]
MGLSPRVVDRGFRVLNACHRAVVEVSRGRLGRRALGMEIIELITVGRRSGRRHRTMLTVPVVDGAILVLVASKGGDDRDPDWFKNLRHTPAVEVIWRGELRPMRARVATPEEQELLWPRVVAAYRGYDSYRARAARPIPLVVCEPVPSAR